MVERNDLFVISDEIYDRLVYGVEHVCFPSLPGMKERTILLGGFSKAYAMTGWRLGWVCAPQLITDAMMRVHQYIMMSAPTAAQYAALEALRAGEEDVQGMLGEYARRRELVIRACRDMGLDLVEPARRLLRLPLDQEHRPGRRGVRRAPAAGRKGRRRPRPGLRPGRRRPHPHLLRPEVRPAGRGACAACRASSTATALSLSNRTRTRASLKPPA